MEGNTAALRSAAPYWSLAGDKQLLDILNNIHQSLVTRCQEVNRKLDEMVSALDGASIDLQNVNNKFMALSNSQFIESRVYDDDVDVAAEEAPKETPKPVSPESDIVKLKRSVATLVAAHETIEILASDSDDDDEEVRLVLKPRDAYAHRPLPHIIGSAAWRAKWHAGLQPEDSDSDSSISKRDPEDEEYSDSEPEAPPAHAQREREESSASSELPSEQDVGLPPAPPAASKPSPSDVAAELARRLGGHVQIPIQEPDYTQPDPVTRKVYKPDQPTPGRIFSDEPPPLDEYISESSDEPEDDIFAELHKNRPNTNSNKEQSRMAEELFAGLKEYEEGDVFSDFRDTQPSPPPAKQKSTLFEDESEPELFADQPVNRPARAQDTKKTDGDYVKKPIGGISLFGNKQGAESIGAAILRRNRPKSSSDDDTTEEVPKKEETQIRSQEKDIFDDLFAKSEREQKRNTKKIVGNVAKEVEKPKPKIDLFSDNIFDDIDDIFTTDVTKSEKVDINNKKSLFDDDDDIFSDIAVTKTSVVPKVDSTNISDKNKNIFDSDDDLFSENTGNKKETVTVSNKTSESHMFESEIDDIFTKSRNNNVDVNHKGNAITNNKLRIDKNSAIQNDNVNNPLNTSFKNEEVYNESAVKSIFDDDENDDLFSSTAANTSTNKRDILTNPKTQSIKSELKKTSLFEDDSDDNDLFASNHSSEDKKSVNKVVKSQNDEISTKSNKISIIDNDFKTDNRFANTTTQVKAQNKKETLGDQSKTETIIKPETQIGDRSQSVFDDEEEYLFRESNEKVVQDKPKPALLKKPAMIPRNNKNGTKKLDENIARTKNIDQGNIVKDKHSDQKNFKQPTDKSSNKSDIEELSTSQTAKDVIQQKAEQDKINLSEEIIETKRSLAEENTSPSIEQKPELSKEKIEPKPLVIPEKSVDNITKHIKPDLIPEKLESVFPVQNLEIPPPLDCTDNDDDDIFADVPNDSSPSKDQEFNTPNVFDDIFSEPPAFEKSKEPKKSKNINALFDDDSDDETSFFKKNDPVIDEKPDLSPEINADPLFGIFHDEPPAIDVDFEQKTMKSNINDDFLKSDSDDDLFTRKTPKNTFDSSFEVSTKPKPPELVSNVEKQSTVLTQSEESITEVEKLDQKAQIDKSKSPIRESPKDATDGEPKKVGKLKSMNFNIDVSTLLPGASPKKKALETKSNEDLNENEINKSSLEQTDGQQYAKSSEDLHFKDKVEPLMVKSVSFEGEPDSQVLDNKISKERAKIQVKRRPSTRRARQEAVKKSGIDFGDDSTDNSSSIDDLPRRKPIVKPRETKIENKDLEKSDDNDVDFDVNLPKTATSGDIKSEVKSDIPKIDKIQTKSDISSSKESQPSENNKFNIDIEENNDQIDSVTKDERESNVANTTKSDPNRQKDDLEFHSEPELKDSKQKNPLQDETKLEPKLDSPKTVTSKIVYILNDEDIFSTPAETSKLKPKTSEIDDDLFKNIAKSSKNSEIVTNISTLGNTYKDTTNNADNINKKDAEKVKKSLFDDISDDEDELFKVNKKTISKPKSILDSDSEEDLFGGRKKETKETKAMIVKETKETKKVAVNSSLFGDEEDDDLFGAKVKSIPAASPQPIRSAREVLTKPAEPVFDDPLSMLGNDD